MNPKLIEDMSWRMAEVYGAVTDRILINLARHFKLISSGAKPGGSWDYQVKKLAELGQVSRETEAIILDTLGDADGVLQELLEESIREGLKGVEKPLKQAAEKGLLLGEGFIPPEISPGQTQAFKAFYQQSADKLNLVNTVMLESTERAYQDTVAFIGAKIGVTQGILNTATGEVVSGVSSLNQAIRDGVKRMVDNGLTGFIDHGGHHWSPEAYVAMDVKTTMFNTARAAVWERQEQYGNDLYQVSHHDGARPLCYPWQGKVISRDDLSREVEDDEGNTVHVYAQSETTYGQPAGLFGINCKHYPIPFIPGFSRIRPPEQNEEENAKEYAESQEQRRLERNLRYEKRDLEVLKAQGASDEEIKAQRLRVKNARTELNNFCDETGRARRVNRERTPIKAEFPEPQGTEKERSEKEKEFSFLPTSKKEIHQEYISSKEYTERFNGITGNPAVDEKIASVSQKMLQHRSGTDFEDLALIDGNTGELIHLLDTSNEKRGVRYDDDTKKAIAKAQSEGKRIIAVHNHPNNYPPSLDDGVSARNHGYTQGIVVGHDGSIYTYTQSDESYDNGDCKAIHDVISETIMRKGEMKNTWFTAMEEFGIIITERR